MPSSEACSGTVEQQVRADVEQLGALDGVDRSLAELAYRLAADIDSATGDDRRLVPSLSRELRAVLAELGQGRKDGDDGDDLDDLADPS